MGLMGGKGGQQGFVAARGVAALGLHFHQDGTVLQDAERVRPTTASRGHDKGPTHKPPRHITTHGFCPIICHFFFS
jgi:hypothetical protein